MVIYTRYNLVVYSQANSVIKLMLKTLTGFKVLVFDDLGFLIAIQIGCRQNLSMDKSEAPLKISMPFTLTLFLAI